ncbi:hypothetical protein ACHQM5_030131 [Ranunculus cassubicifolius]
MEERYTITDCTGDSSINDIAMLAINDHNKKKDRFKLELKSVAKAAVERGTNTSTIYYLYLRLRNVGMPAKLPDVFYATAVWKDTRYPDMHMSLKLKWVDEEQIEESPVKSLSNPEIIEVVEFAIQHHNHTAHKQMSLVMVTSVVSCIKNGFKEYCFTLIAEENNNTMMFNGIVLKYMWYFDDVMESNGLTYLCDAGSTPPWLSVGLILEAKDNFTRNHLLLKPFDSEEEPLLMMKSQYFVSRLLKFAPCIGPEATRETLIPFLNSDLEYDDHSVLIAMAEELGQLIPSVGGPDYAYVLLPPLVSLCKCDHPSVREKALNSLSEIGREMKPCDFVKHYDFLLEDLAAGESVFGRVSSCALFQKVYPHVSESRKTDLRLLYTHLSEDKDYRVRRSAAANLAGVATVMESSHLTTEISSIFMALAKDNLHSIRLRAVTGCHKLVERLEPQYVATNILPVIIQLCQTEVSRGRQFAAMTLYELLGPVSKHVRMEDLVPVFAHLVEDDNYSVRLVVASNIDKICRMKNGRHVLLLCIHKLSCDHSNDVRAALSTGLMDVLQVVRKDLIIEDLFPTIGALLLDDCARVRMNLITKFKQLNQEAERRKEIKKAERRKKDAGS